MQQAIVAGHTASRLAASAQRCFRASVLPPRPQRSRAMSVAAVKQVIATDKAPAALGPYSQAIKAGGTVYVSGQIGLVPGTKDFAGEDVEAQTEQVRGRERTAQLRRCAATATARRRRPRRARAGGAR